MRSSLIMERSSDVVASRTAISPLRRRSSRLLPTVFGAKRGEVRRPITVTQDSTCRYGDDKLALREGRTGVNDVGEGERNGECDRPFAPAIVVTSTLVKRRASSRRSFGIGFSAGFNVGSTEL